MPDRVLGIYTEHLDFSFAPIAPNTGSTVVLDLSDLRLNTAGWEGLAGFFWVGVSWDNAVGLFEGDDVVGQLIFGSPTVGYSADLLADSGGFFSFGGNPQASFGYELTTAVPDPGSDCSDKNWDLDFDGDVDIEELEAFNLCCNGPDIPRDTQCLLSFIDADCDIDGDVDMHDFQSLMLTVNTSG